MAENGRLIKHDHKQYPELKSLKANDPVSIHARGNVQSVNKNDETLVLYDVFDIETESVADKELKKLGGKEESDKATINEDDAF